MTATAPAIPCAATEARHEAARFVRLLHPNGSLFEVRAPECPIFRGANRRKTASVYSADPDGAAGLALEIERLSPPGVYITLNPCVPDLRARGADQIRWGASTTSDNEIAARRWLVLDLDPVRPKDTSATDAEMSLALQLAERIAEGLTSEGWPTPVVCMSGNGAYLLYRVDLPNDDAATKLIEAVTKAIAERFDTEHVEVDTSTYNASRIIKLIGTTARKGADFAGNDSAPARPHRRSWCRWPEQEPEVVPRKLLESLAGDAKPVEPPTRRTTRRAGTAEWNDRVHRCMSYLERCPDAISGDHGHAKTLRAACECFRFALSRSEAKSIMAWYNANKTGGEHWTDAEIEHKLDDAYRKVSEAGEFGIRLVERNSGNNGQAGARVTAGDDAGQRAAQGYLSELYVRMHGDRVRFVYVCGDWLVWDGRRWAKDETGEVYRLAKLTVCEAKRIAAGVEDKDEFKRLCKVINAADSSRGLRDIVTGAEFIAPVPVRPKDLNADRWLLNCKHGTVELKTGTLREHRPGDLITRLAPVEYDERAEHPALASFLAATFGGDDELSAFVQRGLGYTLTGSVSEECLFFLHGPTASGKSTFIEAVRAMLGDYAATISIESLIERKHAGGPREDIARLEGARFVAGTEVADGQRFDVRLVNMLTGGDTVTCRKLYQEAFEFLPQFKLWLAANHAPQVDADDGAIWRRIHRLPFDHSVPEERRDPKVKTMLRCDPAVRAALLTWAIAGLRDYLAGGLRVPDAVRRATRAYRDENDAVRLTEWAELDPTGYVDAESLYDAYLRFASRSGVVPVSKTRLGTRLKDAGCEPRRTGTCRGWAGIRLRGPADEGNEAGGGGE